MKHFSPSPVKMKFNIFIFKSFHTKNLEILSLVFLLNYSDKSVPINGFQVPIGRTLWVSSALAVPVRHLPWA